MGAPKLDAGDLMAAEAAAKMPPRRAAKFLDAWLARRARTPMPEVANAAPAGLVALEDEPIDPKVQAMADADTNEVVNRRRR